MAAQRMATPKLRLIVGGTVIEGVQVALQDLPRTDQGGASELISFLGGAKRVLILQKPLVYGGAEPVESQYLVIRQDQIQACEFVSAAADPDTVTGTVDHDFHWEWDD